MIEQGAQLVSKRSLWYQRSVSSQVGEQTKQFNLRAESKVTQGDTTQRERKIWLSVVDCVSSRGKLSLFRALNSFFYLCGKNKWLTEVFTRMWPHPTLTFDLLLNQGKSHLSAYAAKTLVILDCSRRLDRKRLENAIAINLVFSFFSIQLRSWRYGGYDNFVFTICVPLRATKDLCSRWFRWERKRNMESLAS